MLIGCCCIWVKNVALGEQRVDEGMERKRDAIKELQIPLKNYFFYKILKIDKIYYI